MPLRFVKIQMPVLCLKYCTYHIARPLGKNCTNNCRKLINFDIIVLQLF
jgi:hypothetical protein